MILSQSLLRFWQRSSHPLYDILSQHPWLLNEEPGEISLAELAALVSKDIRLSDSKLLTRSYREVGMARTFAEGLTYELGIQTGTASKARRGEVSPSDPRVKILANYFQELIGATLKGKPVYYPELASSVFSYPKKLDIELVHRPASESPLTSSFDMMGVVSQQIDHLNKLLCPPIRYPKDNEDSSEDGPVPFQHDVVRVTGTTQRSGVIFYSVECSDGQVREAEEEELDQNLVDLYWEDLMTRENRGSMEEDFFEDHPSP